MNTIQPEAFFTTTFRIKLEAMLRLIQHHAATNHRRYGTELAQSSHDNLFSDMLMTLFRARNDDSIDYSRLNKKEWGVFVKIITDEFNGLNIETQKLFRMNIPDIMIITNFNLLTASTCDRIVNRLNTEFNLL